MHEIDSEHPERQGLAKVTHHDLQLGKAIKHPAGDDAQQMQAGFYGKAEYGPIEPLLQKRLDKTARGRIRVQINRYPESFRGFEDLPELRIIEVFVTCVRIDDRALQTQLAHSTRQLTRGRGRLLRCDGCKASQALRVLPNGFRQLIVAGASKCRRRRAIENLYTRAAQGQDLQVHSAAIHVGYALLPQILNSL